MKSGLKRILLYSLHIVLFSFTAFSQSDGTVTIKKNDSVWLEGMYFHDAMQKITDANDSTVQLQNKRSCYRYIYFSPDGNFYRRCYNRPPSNVYKVITKKIEKGKIYPYGTYTVVEDSVYFESKYNLPQYNSCCNPVKASINNGALYFTHTTANECDETLIINRTFEAYMPE